MQFRYLMAVLRNITYQVCTPSGLWISTPPQFTYIEHYKQNICRLTFALSFHWGTIPLGDLSSVGYIYKTHRTILQSGLRKNLNLQHCSFYNTQAIRYLALIAVHCPCATKHTQHRLFRSMKSVVQEIADRVFVVFKIPLMHIWICTISMPGHNPRCPLGANAR